MKPSDRIKQIYEKNGPFKVNIWGADPQQAVEAILQYLDETVAKSAPNKESLHHE